MDNLKRIDITKIYPKFLKLLTDVLEECNNKGSIYIITGGWRSPDIQQRLFNQGRLTPGNVVTNAESFHSYHEFGLAVDACLDKDPVKFGLQPGYSDADLKLLADTAIAKGLESGYFWTKEKQGLRDTPHLQYNIHKLGLSLKDLKPIYQKNMNLQEVWDFLDTHIK